MKKQKKTEKTLKKDSERLGETVKKREAELIRANAKLKAEIARIKQTEETLQKSEAQYKLLLENTPDIIYQYSDKQGGLYYSPRTEAILGYPLSHFYENSHLWHDSIHPDDLPRVDNAIRDFKSGKKIDLEYRIKDAAGNWHWFHDRSIARLTEKGETIIEGLASDITDRKKAEEEAKKAQERLSFHMEEMATLNDVGRSVNASLSLQDVARTSIEHLMEPVNPDFILLSIRKGEELLLQAIGPKGTKFRHHKETCMHRVGECLCGLAFSSGNGLYSRNIHADPRFSRDECKKIGMRSVAALPLHTGEKIIGSLTMASATERDFEEHSIFLEALASEISIGLQNALLYEQLQHRSTELERHVDERTTELAIAKDKAEEADRLKSVFLATMSHELRTPLNSIIGFTGIIRQGVVGAINEEQKKQLGMVSDSAEHLLNLIEDVLDISKIEAGQLELASEHFSMRESIEKVVRTITPLVEKKRLNLNVHVSPEVGEIMGDKRRVEQILINLLSNGIKFTEKGSVTVRCRENKEWLETQVIDTGIGIKPEDKDMLYKPFQQIETGLTRRHEGTGLGLSICKKLVEMMGGEVWVESEWGVGSTFIFTLPMVENKRKKDRVRK